ncbi:hypothetical protein [Urbifossiella limnaea]|uniref:Uncharacterized protein n=1 Tax=Urbifossiella limnaea TaxID=2528023 RepID=A0A517XPK4_9BACT|nr:hypothetical protein [Urbifossiella limnaea]QDU19422.1 hypothetical protein ETAA1_13460 [Urbifossiella limnaea]
MLATILGPLVDRVKVLLAARAVQELEADFLAGAAGRAGGLDKLAAALQADGLDGPAAEVQRRSRGLKAAGIDGQGAVVPPPPPALPGAGRKPRPR